MKCRKTTEKSRGAHAPPRVAEDALVLGGEFPDCGRRTSFREGAKTPHARARVRPGNQRGVALVLTLIMLAIITIVVVVLLATARRNRQSTTVRIEQTAAEFAAEQAFQHANARIIARILQDTNLLSFDLLASVPSSYIVTNRPQDVGFPAWPFPSTNHRPYSLEIPVVANRTGSVDVYLDLNRDRQFNHSGDPLNAPLGDPIWVGVRDNPLSAGVAQNRFVQRFAYIVLPVGKQLDLNTIHNNASPNGPLQSGRFLRNQGFGPWEINLAAFLAELNPDVWWVTPNGNQVQYNYGPFPRPIADGDAFLDARSIVEYRLGWDLSRRPVIPLATVFPQAIVAPQFPPLSIDAYSDGYYDGSAYGNVLGANIVQADDDTLPALAKLTGRQWAGADFTNHWFSPQEFFDNVSYKVTNAFLTNLTRAIYGYAPDGIQANPLAYYRMIDQLGTDTSSDYHERINLNYAAIGTNSAEDFIPWDANPVLAMMFFTNVAERIFQAQLDEFNPITNGVRITNILSITEIPVYPRNLYSTAIHRILQEAANIFDATRTNIYPSVFRPVFGPGRTPGVNYIVGFTNDDRVSTLQSWLNSNTNGIPLVVGAKKWLPNFNEYTLRSDITVARKLQMIRNTPPRTGVFPIGTNQMFILGISNSFCLEAWNSYSFRYPRPVTITVSNFTTMSLTNDAGFQVSQTMTALNTTNLAARQWLGSANLRLGVQTVSNSFLVPFCTNQVFLSNAVYVFGNNTFANISTNAFETDYTFRLPYWIYTISNRVSYLMSEQAGGYERIVDFVLLNDTQTVDLYRDLVAAANPYLNPAGGSAALANLWNTNRNAPNAPTVGVIEQAQISLGTIPTANSEWRSFAQTQTATENDKQAAIDLFRVFCGLSPQSTNVVATNMTLAMETPFNPAAKLSVLSTWQANDPLVHYHVQDLRTDTSTNRQYLKPTQSGTNVSPASLGRLNDRYSPWGGKFNSSAELPDTYDRRLKDPGVYGSDDWEFPTNKLASIGLLGRIHRGTPWQTIYFKAEAAPIGGTAGWTNQSVDIAIFPNGREFSRTHPSNDWRLADMFTTAIDERTSRGLMSINQTNIESWSALLSGVAVLSNNLSTAVIADPRSYESQFIEPWGRLPFAQSQFALIWSNIYWFQRTNGWTAQHPSPVPLSSIGDLLQVPELTTASPFLNLSDPEQLKWGIDDFAYERIPQQILSLLRIGQSRFVIYAYGQALKPALIDPGTGNVVNYQVTAEYATRSVVRVEGDPRGRVRTVVESFNILPPD